MQWTPKLGKATASPARCASKPDGDGTRVTYAIQQGDARSDAERALDDPEKLARGVCRARATRPLTTGCSCSGSARPPVRVFADEASSRTWLRARSVHSVLSACANCSLLRLRCGLAACDVGEVDVMQQAVDDYAAGQDPCKDPAILKPARTSKPTKTIRIAFVGTNGDDVIVGIEGDDEIYGARRRRSDLRARRQRLYRRGGDGKDRIYAGDGDDIVHEGRGASDWIYGGPGDDLLFGDILDDQHLRRGRRRHHPRRSRHRRDGRRRGRELHARRHRQRHSSSAARAIDIASFATALPPGQPRVRSRRCDREPDRRRARHEDHRCDEPFATTCTAADGDGGNEEAPRHFDMIVGSPFSDSIDPNGRDVQSGLGEDVIDGVKTGTPTPTKHGLHRLGEKPRGPVDRRRRRGARLDRR